MSSPETCGFLALRDIKLERIIRNCLYSLTNSIAKAYIAGRVFDSDMRLHQRRDPQRRERKAQPAGKYMNCNLLESVFPRTYDPSEMIETY
jgi:hypothetical protein